MSSFVRQAIKRFIRVGGHLLLGGACLLTVSCSKSETVELTLIIENALAPAGLSAASLPQIQQVAGFVVTISGEDLDQPVILNLDTDTTGTSLKDIPYGSSRIILVEAKNSEGMVVRRKEVTGITIDREQTEPIVVSLNTVPLFTNLRDGSRVIVTRLQMLGVGEPEGRLEIMDDFGGTQDVLFDMIVGDSLVSPSISAGDFTFLPPELSLGMHTFTVSDLDNGEQSSVTVRLIPPGSMPGIGIVSFGGMDLTHVTSGGIPWNSFDVDLAHFPDVLLRRLQ